nr:mat [Erythrocladia irregularis]
MLFFMLKHSDYNFLIDNNHLPSLWKDMPWKKINIAVKKMQRNIYKASIDGDAQMIKLNQKILLEHKLSSVLAAHKSLKSHYYQTKTTVDKNREFIGTIIHGSYSNQRLCYLLRYEKLDIQIAAIRMLILLALQPEWEARVESNSYGFLSGFTPKQAIVKAYSILSQNIDYENSFVIVGEINDWFDGIDTKLILSKTIYKDETKQNLFNLFRHASLCNPRGVIPDKFQSFNMLSFSYNSPSLMLANIFVYGLEKALLWKFYNLNHHFHNSKSPIVNIIIYSNHFLIIFSSKNLKNTTIAINTLDDFLSSMKQTLNISSLNMRFINEGIDFLGCHFKRYPNTNSWNYETSKILIQPTKDNIKKHLLSLRQCLYHKDRFNRWRANSHMTESAVINKLNPLIKRFSDYYQDLVPLIILTKIDKTLNEMIYRYAIKKYKANKYQKWQQSWIQVIQGKKMIGYQDHINSQYRLLLLHDPSKYFKC